MLFRLSGFSWAFGGFHLHDVISAFLTALMEAEWIGLQRLHCTRSLLPSADGSTAGMGSESTNNSRAAFFFLSLSALLSDHLFLYVLSFSFPSFSFSPAVFLRYWLADEPAGAGAAASEESSVLPPERLSPFVGVGVRTSLSPALSPCLKAQEGIVWTQRLTRG